MILVIGIILIVLSIILMLNNFSKNEWRAPLLELKSELKGELWKEVVHASHRRGLFLTVFFLLLFCIGGYITLRSSVLRNYENIVLIMLVIVLFWLLKGAYELIMASYSKKTMLLNYLFSPYLFAWRRDRLSEYSDQEIATAICKVCNIQDSGLIQKNTNLVDFLIALHRRTRPSVEHDAYSEILEENMKQADKMVQI